MAWGITRFYSVDYVREGRWKGRTACLGWRVSEHWSHLIHGCPALAAEPWTMLFVQWHPWRVLTSGTSPFHAYPFNLIPLCLTCWFCIKKRGWYWNQHLLYGYRIWEAPCFQIFAYWLRPYSSSKIILLKRRRIVKASSCIFSVCVPNLFDFLRFDTCVHYFWDLFERIVKV